MRGGKIVTRLRERVMQAWHGKVSHPIQTTEVESYARG